MNQDGVGNEPIGVIDTLTQMIKVLGFHDLTSFVLVSIFVIAAAAFLVSGIIVIVKKRRERLHELETIVTQIQNEEKQPDAILPTPDVPVQQPVAQPQPSILPKKESAKLSEEPKKIVAPLPSTVKEVHLPEEKMAPLAPPAKKIPKAPVKPIVHDKPAIKKLVEPVHKSAAHPVPAPIEEVPPASSVASVDEKKDHQVALGAALKNTRGGFIEKLGRLFSRSAEVSDADFEEMEAILFTADIGVKTAQKLLDVMRERAHKEKSVSKEFLRNALKEEMTRILESAKSLPADQTAQPQVIMFVGVNGAGKTTSIGKLGAQLTKSGKKVLFGAGDTFRAAAVEQLSIWGQRVGAEVVSGKENSDSAAVLFEAIDKAKNNHVDYVLCDTAGRLHTKVSLMEELKKVHRVVSKAQEGAPHQVFLVIDATMGQNAINQAREFALATPLTGVVLSKLDGTAKGGVALGIVDELKVPIRYIGIGEQVSDLKDFDAKLFVDALFEEA